MGVKLTIVALDGKTIATTWNIAESYCWDTAVPVIAEWFGVSPDDVHITDTDDGDFVTVGGKIVAQMQNKWDHVA